MSKDDDPPEIDDDVYLVDAEGNRVELEPVAIGLNSLEYFILAGGNPLTGDPMTERIYICPNSLCKTTYSKDELTRLKITSEGMDLYKCRACGFLFTFHELVGPSDCG